MFAAVLAAVSSLQKILCGKYNVALFAKVVIILI